MQLQDKRIALLATNGFEDSELMQPLEALEQAGAVVTIVSSEEGTITGKDGTEIDVDVATADTDSHTYDGLLLPGGVANPDALRLDKEAVAFVHGFFDAGAPVAAICHAPWLLIEADVVRGRTLTSWPSVKTDIVNAGGVWVDQPVVIDHELVTSRQPDDLPAFCDAMIETFATAPAEAVARE